MEFRCDAEPGSWKFVLNARLRGSSMPKAIGVTLSVCPYQHPVHRRLWPARGKCVPRRFLTSIFKNWIELGDGSVASQI